MKIYNEIDDQGRYYGFKATTETGEQVNTHGYSYLYIREQLQESEMEMGLERMFNPTWIPKGHENLLKQVTSTRPK